MNRKKFIAPSILSADFLRLGEQINAAQEAGADWVHIDVMDGHFVPNLTMGPFVVEHCRRATRLPLDVHLMVSEPGHLLPAFVRAGADHLTIHVEACAQPAQVLAEIRALGCRAGIAINPDTPASVLEPYLSMIDMVLVMTVHPGYSGQSFMAEVVPKIGEIRQMLERVDSPADLEVDGGIATSTLPQVYAAGANAFVAAKAIFGHPQGIGAGVRELRALLDSPPA